jgi:hypothetical protein
MKTYIFFFLSIILFSCKIKDEHLLLPEKKVEITPFYNGNSDVNFLYEDFPNEDLNLHSILLEEEFSGGFFFPREGKISNEGFKEGKFVSANTDYDTITHQKKIIKLRKIEYFKKGLRDSIFQQFDYYTGKIIYETIFKNGTGLWKEFHYNGKPYFEAYTKDGYFIDTLRLYDYRSRLQGVRLYKKDSLIYSRDFDTDVVDTLEDGKKVKITYKKHWVDSNRQYYYIFEKKYSDKIMRFDYKNKLIYYKTDTLINNIKKEFTKTNIEDNICEKTEESLYTYTLNPNEKIFDLEGSTIFSIAIS